jgi:type II secretory pathway pseudopilin PulG
MARATKIGSAVTRLSEYSREGGVVLLAVLLFVLVSTLGAGSLFQMHQTQSQRDREEQLLFAGDQYRRAIISYYNTIPPGGTRSLPQSLDDLLNDHRFPTPLQHLRREYPDPMTGKPDWELILVKGRIGGVRSSSNQPTLKKAGFGKDYKQFEGSSQYADWVFAI